MLPRTAEGAGILGLVSCGVTALLSAADCSEFQEWGVMLSVEPGSAVAIDLSKRTEYVQSLMDGCLLDRSGWRLQYVDDLRWASSIVRCCESA